jgi:hypothetical protein
MTHCAPVQVVSAVRHHLGHLSPMEAEMRTTTAILAGLMALSVASVQAAPLAPPRATSAELGSVPPIEPVRDGCGYGYYRTRWQDQWGYWH